MALQETRAPSSGIFGAIKQALGLFSDLNKTDSSQNDNLNPTPHEEYESSYSELQIVQLIRQWKEDYAKYYHDIEPSQTIAFEYWLGKQRGEDNSTIATSVASAGDMVDNQIFPAVETFIPIATRSNPDPIVKADPSAEGQALASAIKTVLVYEADRQKLKKLLKRIIRHWLIYKIGVLKYSYNISLDRIETEVINPKRMIFDPNGHIDVSGKFTGTYIGERKQNSAAKLKELFPKKKMEIDIKSQGKDGTKIEYIEWWYKGTDVFYTLDQTVLGKYKNPHWNYDVKATTQESTDENGAPTTEVITPEQEGKNFHDKPLDPYVFLSIFSTGLQPHDETSLITQNISIQDMVNRRWRQLDKNIDSMNNSLAVGNAFTAEQASQAASALRRGVAIRVPSGDIRTQVMRMPAEAIPADVFNNLRDSRLEIQNIFGTSGSTPQGQASEQTARGKILVNQLDSSRIGGGITEYLEQVADTVYNGWVQLMFVHFTEPHYFVSAGSNDAQTLISIKNSDFLMTKTLDITVKDGSLIPKDPLTQRNEAIDLWSANAIDPLSLFKKLDFPDPAQATDQLILWQMLQKGQIQPQQYLPSFSVAQAQPPQGQPQIQGTGGPAVNSIGPNTPPQAPAPATGGAVEQQSKQLMESVKV